MEPTQVKPKVSVTDFFLNLGATISLYTVVVSLINLLFTVINNAYPKITNGYFYSGSSTISWPVAVLVIFTPILILVMWLLEKEYKIEPERQERGVHKWLTYLTLFIASLVIAGDLITVLYYFIDGQELDMAFMLKCLALLVVSSAIFGYYLSDIRGKLNSRSRKVWRVVALAIVLGSIILGFAVLGSPRTQKLYKYDEAKVNDLMNIDGAVQSYYGNKGTLPKSFEDLATLNYYINRIDSQTQKNYEYIMKTPTTYELCAEFNMTSKNESSMAQYPYGGTNWTHPAGRHCFAQTINPSVYPGKMTI